MADAPYQVTDDSLETNFRATIGDPASNPAQRWNEAEAVAYLNRGAAQLVLDIPNALETQWEVSTASGTREYLLPVNFILDKRVEYVVTASSDVRVLTYLDEAEWKAARFPEDKSGTGDPQFYTFMRKLGDDPTTESPMHIVLEPTPDAIKTLRIYGYKLPDVIAAGGTGVPELAVPKLEAVVAWACHLASSDDNDDTRADRFQRRYEIQMAKIRHYITEMSLSRSSRLKPWNVDDNLSPVLPWNRRVI